MGKPLAVFGRDSKLELRAIDEAVSRASLDPSYWIEAMDVVARSTGSAGAVLLPLHGRHPGLPYSDSIAPMMRQYFAEGWHTRDERTRGLYLFDLQKAFGDLDLFTSGQIERLPYYQDLMGKHGLRWFGGIIVSSGTERWCICIQRTINQGPFSRRDIAAFGRRSARLSGAAALGYALGFAQAEAALDALDASASPVVLVDRVGNVHKANNAAERLFRDGVLRLAGHRLTTVSTEATTALESALSALLWEPRPDALVPPVVLPRSDGRRSVLAYPVRFPAFDANPFGPARAALIFRDLDAAPDVLLEDLRAVLGLTRTEAKVTQALVAGRTLEQAARELHIAEATARVHLRAIFAKTGTTRQSELLMVVLRFLRPTGRVGPSPGHVDLGTSPGVDISDVARAGVGILDGRAEWRGRF